ncbi:hypothetical protein OIN60_07445 [Paenibacillus sp. P96]|uniref:Multi-tm2 domain protein n=1 Tax=Paenibacillus zeirhizosphaerae TaxID=2987519 RepID=A0ABT9FPE3_9BACL|nr:hypothetical protein [Paenibacillus sp. P96]MDP4096601.1 hypothetical protein [Paenibacillus sp. P96]
MPYAQRSRLLALLLNMVPGLGFLYWSRKIAGILYMLLFFGGLGGGVLLFAISGDDFFLMLTLLGAVAVWGIGMLHLLLRLLRSPSADYTAANDPHAFHGQGGAAYPGGFPDYPPYPPHPEYRDSEKLNTILLSFVPGLGHLYMGLMQRGLSFLITFFGVGVVTFFAAVITNTESFLVVLGFLPVIWLYCMFDALRYIEHKQAGDILSDRTLFEEFELGRVGGRRSKVLAMILSAFPGAGQMYLGLQKRGLQMMLLFVGGIYVLDVLRLSVFLFLIPVIWFYSFFDGLQQASRYEREPLEDRPILDMFVQHQKLIGVILVCMGVYFVVMNMFVPFIDVRFPEWNLQARIDEHLRTVVVSLVLIGGGTRLLMGTRRRSL